MTTQPKSVQPKSVQPKAVAALVAVTALLAGGYLLSPVPGATASPAALSPSRLVAAAAVPASTQIQAAPPTLAQARLGGTTKAARAPVPLLVNTPREYFVPNPADTAPTVVPASATTTAGATAVGDDSAMAAAAARAAIERDGYRNVRGLVKGADGTWRGRAFRGPTEIAVIVDTGGSVSAD